MLLTALYLLVAASWTVAALYLSWCSTRVRDLPGLPEGRPSAPLPRVSVIVAVRDDVGRIGTTVERLLAQQHVDLQLVVVDDRSVDGTGALLDGLREAHPRLDVVHVRELPERWLGVCHAQHVGAARATGDWLLFTDSDVWMRPDAVARAVAAGEAEAADHVFLLSGLRECTFLGKAVVLIFCALILPNVDRVNRDVPGAFASVGAFGMVRASAYRAVGGHLPLRLEVINDQKLALLFSHAGFRARGYFAAGTVDVPYLTSPRQFVRDLEKNLFAAVEYNPWSALGLVAGVSILWSLPLLGLLSGTPAGLLAFAGLSLMALPALAQARKFRWPAAAALLSPFCFAWFVVAVLNSTLKTLLQDGVRWRGTHYPLAMLREGLVTARSLGERRCASRS